VVVCRRCQRPFTPFTERTPRQRYDFSFQARVANLYYSAEGSYRAVARQLSIRANTAFKITNQLGANCKSFLQVARELRSQWSGFLLVDGKAISVGKRKYALLLTADAQIQDIPCAHLCESENLENYFSLLETVRNKLSYPIKGLTVDGDSGLVSAARAVFPGTPLQLCVHHLDEFRVYYFHYRYKGSAKAVGRFLDLTHQLLYARRLKHLQRLIQQYLVCREEFCQAGLDQEIKNFERKFDYLWTHLKHPGLPRTTNIIESIIHQLSRKIDRTDGFRSAKTAWNSLKLLIMKFRFHTFTCSRIKGHNGYSPLSLAKVITNDIDWVIFSQKKHH
jgi:hypothetical protein